MDIQDILNNPYVSKALSWISFGLVIGILSKLILPGSEGLGWIRTILLGIIGAFVGSFAAANLGYTIEIGWNLPSIGASVGGSILLLLVNRLVTKT